MVTSADLKVLTVKELTDAARQWEITGWHEMRKDDLIRALVNRARSKLAQQSKLPPEKLLKQCRTAASKPAGKTATSQQPKSSANKSLSKSRQLPPSEKALSKEVKPDKTAVVRKQTSLPRTEAVMRPQEPKTKGERSKKQGVSKAHDISSLKEKMLHDKEIRISEQKPGQEDRLVLMVRDPFWIHAFWEIGIRAVERAKVALGHYWHAAKPVLRLYKNISDGVTNPRRVFQRDIPIHGGVNNWYIDVSDPPAMFQIEIGYQYTGNRFYSIASSNIVQTPQNQVTDDVDQLDGNWSGIAADFDRVFKLSGGLETHNKALKSIFEEKLRRPMTAPLLSRFGPRPQGNEKTRRNFNFCIEADIVLFGQTDPSVQISIKGEPIRLNPDGSFSVRFSLPEKRHVFPIDASSSDGVETQRVILAIERNTKILETLIVEHEEEE